MLALRTVWLRRYLLYLALGALVAVACLCKLNDFLAITRPIEGNILVVESWFWDSPAIREAMDEFDRGRYDWLVAVGPPLSTAGRDAVASSAELLADRFRHLGADEARVVALTVPQVTLHQTYTAALAVKHWLRGTGILVKGLNVFTLGTHARKSFVLFGRAFGPDQRLGVIAGTEHTYNPTSWWLSARGIHVVTRKTIGYLYALFWPLPHDINVITQTSPALSSLRIPLSQYE
jgi:hypothetical protein